MKSKHISRFDEFKSAVNESGFPTPGGGRGSSPQFNKRISAQTISERGLESVITEDFFLDLWFDSYFKNRSGDSSYDYRQDEDFWNHTDEILDPQSDEEREILNNPSTFDSYHDHHWADTLNYIISKRPNPLTEADALEDAIKNALSNFNSSRRR